MGFGNDIKKIRQAKGYTLRAFAKLADISPTYLSKMEHETLPPCGAEAIARMADILGIDPDVTCLKAGKIPNWIRERLFTSPIDCVHILKDLK